MTAASITIMAASIDAAPAASRLANTATAPAAGTAAQHTVRI
jgi:hypothetical protein